MEEINFFDSLAIRERGGVLLYMNDRIKRISFLHACYIGYCIYMYHHFIIIDYL